MINVVVKKDSKWRQLYAPDESIRYVLVYGPRLGGKSFRASQATILQMTSWPYFRAYIMRNVLDNVRDTIFQDCWDRVIEHNLPLSVIESNLTIKWGSNELKGRGFKKSSGKDTAKQKSLAGRNVVVIEEAEETDKDDFTQLDLSLRTTKGQVVMYLVFNPPEKGHWTLNEWFDLLPATISLAKEIYGVDLTGITDDNLDGFFVMKPKLRTDTAYIFSNYKDNLKHLDPNVIDRAERLKVTDLEYYLHKIIGLVPSGRTGRVFKKYTTISRQEYNGLPYNKLFGLDFGSNDPTTLIECMVHDKSIYISEVFYKQGMTIDDIDEQLLDINDKVIADSSAKQTIETLKMRGRWLEASVKGADSVTDGIRKLLSYDIVIVEDSSNVLSEFENYVWKLDRFGIPTDKPEDKHNHAIDAIRYSIEDLESFDYENTEYL